MQMRLGAVRSRHLGVYIKSFWVNWGQVCPCDNKLCCPPGKDPFESHSCVIFTIFRDGADSARKNESDLGYFAGRNKKG